MKKYQPRPKSTHAKVRSARVRSRKLNQLSQAHERNQRFTQWPLPGEEEIK